MDLKAIPTSQRQPTETETHQHQREAMGATYAHWRSCAEFLAYPQPEEGGEGAPSRMRHREYQKGRRLTQGTTSSIVLYLMPHFAACHMFCTQKKMDGLVVHTPASKSPTA
jgi:hypothetical protein